MQRELAQQLCWRSQVAKYLCRCRTGGLYVKGKVSAFALQFCLEGKLDSQRFLSPSEKITVIFFSLFFQRNNMHRLM